MIGWINAFNRWTRTTMVRRWWIFLISLFTPGMRKLAEAHFGVPGTFGGEPPLEVRFRQVSEQQRSHSITRSHTIPENPS
jgi:hypothetical protein